MQGLVGVGMNNNSSKVNTPNKVKKQRVCQWLSEFRMSGTSGWSLAR